MKAKPKSKFSMSFRMSDRIEADLGGGVKAVAHLEHASETSPDEFDCYTPAELKAYDAGEWYYGTVTMTVEVNGAKVGRSLTAIGGVEIHPDRDDGFDAANEAAEELLEECPVAKIVGDFAKVVAKAARDLKRGGSR